MAMSGNGVLTIGMIITIGHPQTGQFGLMKIIELIESCVVVRGLTSRSIAGVHLALGVNLPVR